MKWPGRASGEPKRGVAFTAGSFAGVELRQPRRQLEGHEVRAEILDLAGEVAELPRLVDEARLLGALGAIANELH